MYYQPSRNRSKAARKSVRCSRDVTALPNLETFALVPLCHTESFDVPLVTSDFNSHCPARFLRYLLPPRQSNMNPTQCKPRTGTRRQTFARKKPATTLPQMLCAAFWRRGSTRERRIVEGGDLARAAEVTPLQHALNGFCGARRWRFPIRNIARGTSGGGRRYGRTENPGEPVTKNGGAEVRELRKGEKSGVGELLLDLLPGGIEPN